MGRLRKPPSPLPSLPTLALLPKVLEPHVPRVLELCASLLSPPSTCAPRRFDYSSVLWIRCSTIGATIIGIRAAIRDGILSTNPTTNGFGSLPRPVILLSHL